MAAEEKKLTGIDETEAGFIQEPELSPIERIEADSFVVSEVELEKELKDAGIEVPQAPEKEATPIPETAIGMEEAVFAEEPVLSPIEQLEADEYIASPAEILKDMKEAGID